MSGGSSFDFGKGKIMGRADYAHFDKAVDQKRVNERCPNCAFVGRRAKAGLCMSQRVRGHFGCNPPCTAVSDEVCPFASYDAKKGGR